MQIRVPVENVKTEVSRILASRGISAEKLKICSDIITNNSLDGVSSHGLTRLPSFVSTIDGALVKINTEPQCIQSFGAIEKWDGKRGLGPYVAMNCIERAMKLAREFGIGCVAVKDTSHWLRGGTYGRHAAENGFASICWTNSQSGMPAWGGKNLRLGNNPMVFSLPGEPPVVMDFALSQFSYGRIQEAAMANTMLPADAAYDLNGELTRDPHAILETIKQGAYRLLPTGLWKGSSLAFTLDAMAALLSGGLATREIEMESNVDVGISQVFIVFDIERIMGTENSAERLNDLIDYLKQGNKGEDAEDVRYPGESVWKTRQENLIKGVPVNKKLWGQLKNL